MIKKTYEELEKGIIKCRQLCNEGEIDNNMLKDIAGLIYDTDPYIYPAMFESRDNAIKIIPELIRKEDKMFQMDNLYIAEYQNKVIGIVLWNKGKLEWSKEMFIETVKDLRLPVSKYLDMVTEGYINSYADIDDKIISIVNFCISEEIRGVGAGKQMMESFIREHEDEILELCVLEENPAAVRLYQKYGFEETERYQGFSVDHRELVCIGMKKTNNKGEK